MWRNIAQRRKNSFSSCVRERERNGKRGFTGKRERGKVGTHPLSFSASFRFRFRFRFRSFLPFPFRPCVACVVSVSFLFRSAVTAFRSVSFPFPSVLHKEARKATRKPHEAKQTHGVRPVSFRRSQDEGGGEGGHPRFVHSQFMGVRVTPYSLLRKLAVQEGPTFQRA